MHELSLCSNALEIMEQAAKAQGAKQITAVWIEIGALSCIEPDALEFCFELVCRDTIAQECKLHIIQAPATAWCFDCKQEVKITTASALTCPQRGGIHLRTSEASDQIQIKQLEIE